MLNKMPGIKPIVITFASIVSLVFIWTQLSPKSEPVKKLKPGSQQISKQIETTHPNTALLMRIESLEDELATSHMVQQRHEIRLAKLEKQLTLFQQKSHQISNTKPDKELTDSVKTTKKPATLHDKLISSNIPLDTIQRIQSRIGENRLARLQLRNKAIREDWIDTPEYLQQVQQLPSATGGLRDEFGDQVYDQYLYASGRPNRVMVREVFIGSAAKEAGIEPKDIIISYASNTIYSMSDLQQATTEGDPDETILIELLRNDLPFSTSAQRGPLGISMTITRIEPE